MALMPAVKAGFVNTQMDWDPQFNYEIEADGKWTPVMCSGTPGAGANYIEHYEKEFAMSVLYNKLRRDGAAVEFEVEEALCHCSDGYSASVDLHLPCFLWPLSFSITSTAHSLTIIHLSLHHSSHRALHPHPNTPPPSSCLFFSTPSPCLCLSPYASHSPYPLLPHPVSHSSPSPYPHSAHITSTLDPPTASPFQ